MSRGPYRDTGVLEPVVTVNAVFRPPIAMTPGTIIEIEFGHDDVAAWLEAIAILAEGLA